MNPYHFLLAVQFSLTFLKKDEHMRKIMRMRYMLASSCALFLSCGVMQATVHWSGTTTPDVIDQDLVIDDDCILTKPCDSIKRDPCQNFVRIKAQTRDIVITVNKDVTVDSSLEVPTLFLEPLNGHNIVFELNHNLKFRGALPLLSGKRAVAPGAPIPLLNNDLFIFVRGDGLSKPGEVVFSTRGQCSVIFDLLADGNKKSGGAKLYTLMDKAIDQKPVVVRFTRNKAETDIEKTANAIIEIGEGGALGYASQYPISEDGVSEFVFEPENSGSGRMILSIKDKGSVVISGRKINDVDPYSDDMNFNAINLNEPAGCQAVLRINNPSVTGTNSGLMVLNNNQTLSKLLIWFPSSITGEIYGFVLGNNGHLDINSGSYLDYVGLAIDSCPDIKLSEMIAEAQTRICSDSCNCSLGNIFPDSDVSPQSIFKKRNPSAFIIDGFLGSTQIPACISMDSESAIFLRSGVNCNGFVENQLDSIHPFTVSSHNRTAGAGNMVLDVEGCLTICGAGTDRVLNPTKIEVLSLNVNPTGAPVLIGGTGLTTFPKRDFASDGNNFLSFNSAYIFVNSYMILNKTWLVHTDQNHKVYENDDVNSEPTYVGGEMYKYIPWAHEPKMIFSNSQAFWHTSVALTGLDLLIPNALKCCLPCVNESTMETIAIKTCPDCGQTKVYPCHRAQHMNVLYKHLTKGIGDPCAENALPCDNLSKFIYFYNGYTLDNGTGRQMILGTFPGSATCDCCRVINNNAQLDVMQLADQSCTCNNAHELALQVEANDNSIIFGVPSNINGQYSINTIYLGNSSNITIGSRTGHVPVNFSCPELVIDGNFFSFGTRGGQANAPALSNVTGQGGIFVDEHGTIRLGNTCSVNMGAMVTKSGTGKIDLPEALVNFALSTGEADWKLDLNKTPIIIPTGANISDYTLNWIATCKADGFIPFMPTRCLPCECSAVQANVTGLPTVLGSVDQLQVQGSRIGDPAHIKVGKGGYVRELIFQPGCPSAEAATGVVVLEDGGHIGLGSAHTSADSLYASVVLGVNGVTIIGNGNGRVTLNEDLVINNVCHIVAGPSFAGHTLRIDSDCCRTIRVKNTGILDLSSFTGDDPTANVIQFGGNIKIILEPGAQIVWGVCTLQLADQANMVCEPVQIDLIPTTKTSLTDLDKFRVKFLGGPGILHMTDCSFVTINQNAYASVESNNSLSNPCPRATNLTFEVNDQSKFLVGSECDFGGSFQVGNSADQGSTVTWILRINGNNATFNIDQQAFVGLGAGIVYKNPSNSTVPNDWVVAPLYNVTNIQVIIENGIFSHNVIRSGDSDQGSALVFGSSAIFGLDFTGRNNRRITNVSRSTMRGGGNLVYITGLTELNIADDSTDTVGIMASGPIFNSDNTTFVGTAQELFNFWKYFDFDGSATQLNARVDVGQGKRHEMRIGYVHGNKIQRVSWIPIVGGGSTTGGQDHSFDIAAAGAMLVRGSAKPREIQDIRILQ